MARNGSALFCPFRQAEYVPTGERMISGEMKVTRQESKCGTWCPHFNLQNIPNEENGKSELHVLLTCGTNDTIHPIHEVIEPQKNN